MMGIGEASIIAHQLLVNANQSTHHKQHCKGYSPKWSAVAAALIKPPTQKGPCEARPKQLKGHSAIQADCLEV